jgi:hypothetical protein
MGEGISNICFDLSKNATTVTATLVSTTWTIGPGGRSPQFNGTSSYLALTGTQQSPSAQTWSFWVAEKSRLANAAFFSTNNFGGPFNEIFSNNGVLSYVNLSAAIVSTGYTVPLNELTHIVATMTGTTLQLYVNGRLWTTVTDNNFNSHCIPVTIGGWCDNAYNSTVATANWFSGIISNFRIYNRVITAGEARRLYVEPFAGMLPTMGVRALTLDGFDVPAAAAGLIKTRNGLAWASVKSVDGLAAASVKTINGLAAN